MLDTLVIIHRGIFCCSPRFRVISKNEGVPSQWLLSRKLSEHALENQELQKFLACSHQELISVIINFDPSFCLD